MYTREYGAYVLSSATFALEVFSNKFHVAISEAYLTEQVNPKHSSKLQYLFPRQTLKRYTNVA